MSGSNSATNLQNGLYNFMMEALGMTNSSNLQLIQPAIPLPAGTTNTTVWNFMNEIPKAQLSGTGASGDQFFSDYSDCVNTFAGISLDLESEIGTAAYNAWNAYQSANPNLNPLQFPSLFFTWAITHGYASIANKGKSYWTAVLNDPVSRAQAALDPYDPATATNPKAPDWSLGYTDLVTQLAKAPSRTLASASLQSNSNVSKTWAGSSSGGGFLLWGGGSSSSSSSFFTEFASSGVSSEISFEHVLSYVAVPGAWYDSSVFALAYSKKTGAPWDPQNTEYTWNTMFGPTGQTQRFVSSLIVVSGMKFTMTSGYAFSTSQQTTITHNSGGGFWPFYSTSSDSSMTTGHSFNKEGCLTVTTNSVGSVPTLIGCIVLPAEQYLT